MNALGLGFMAAKGKRCEGVSPPLPSFLPAFLDSFPVETFPLLLLSFCTQALILFFPCCPPRRTQEERGKVTSKTQATRKANPPFLCSCKPEAKQGKWKNNPFLGARQFLRASRHMHLQGLRLAFTRTLAWDVSSAAHHMTSKRTVLETACIERSPA